MLFVKAFNDETFPNFIKRKHPRKGEKHKQTTRTRIQANKEPKRVVPHGGKGTIKYQNLH
jgi:hypothetical protein